MTTQKHSSRTPLRTDKLQRFARDERGAGLLEYIILAGIVAIGAVIGFQTFGGQLRDKATEQGTAVGTIPGTIGGGAAE